MRRLKHLNGFNNKLRLKVDISGVERAKLLLMTISSWALHTKERYSEIISEVE